MAHIKKSPEQNFLNTIDIIRKYYILVTKIRKVFI